MTWSAPAVAQPAASTRPAAFDLSGVHAYWRVVDALRERTVSLDSAIAQLGRHPGYALIQRNGGRMRVVGWCLRRLFPQHPSDTTTPPPNRPEIHQRACPHLQQALRERDALARFAAILEGGRGTAWLQAAVEEAAQLLPASVAGTAPPAYVLLFEDNGFGGSALALDLLRLMRSDSLQTVRYLAHELHHSAVLRLPADVPPLPADALPPLSQAWLSMLGRVQLEGVASLLDKEEAMRPDALAPPASVDAVPPSLRDHAARLANVPAMLAAIDRAPTPEARADALRASVDDGGHALGHYMAAAIERTLGRDTLVAVVGRRFAFFDAYVQASARQASGAFTFSPAVVREVRALAERLRGEQPAGQAPASNR